jgi:hypothetical protein
MSWGESPALAQHNATVRAGEAVGTIAGYDRARATQPEGNAAKDHDPVLDRGACTVRRKPPCDEYTNAPGRSTGEPLSSAMTLLANHGGLLQSRPRVTHGRNQGSPCH